MGQSLKTSWKRLTTTGKCHASSFITSYPLADNQVCSFMALKTSVLHSLQKPIAIKRQTALQEIEYL